ncbi:MAG: hypothetical protein P4L50_19115 [Anaerolineaceae bacterium]|nr:hypothetical protein [Anaerolineaceae bacterium]
MQTIDPTTGEATLTTTIDSQGNCVQQTAASNINYPQFVQAIADTLASQIISNVLIKNNLPASISAQAFRTLSETEAAKKQVKAGRAQLQAAEEKLLLDTATAFLDVVRDEFSPLPSVKAYVNHTFKRL